jgi:hypothetical protein
MRGEQRASSHTFSVSIICEHMCVGQQREGFRLVCRQEHPAACRLPEEWTVRRRVSNDRGRLGKVFTVSYNGDVMQYNTMDGKMPWCTILMYVCRTEDP